MWGFGFRVCQVVWRCGLGMSSSVWCFGLVRSQVLLLDWDRLRRNRASPKQELELELSTLNPEPLKPSCIIMPTS